MRKLKHLCLEHWPEADHDAFRVAYTPGDIFDDTGGPGAHFKAGTRQLIETAYRRWLAFLDERFPSDIPLAPADRITPERVREFIEHISPDIRATSVGIYVSNLYHGARLIAPSEDWHWLRTLASRLNRQALPEDRFDRLIPTWHLLDHGIQLMETAMPLLSTNRREREIQYRDGLLLAVLSLWPIRRRSVAALTVTRHIELDDDGVTLLLHSEDTKSKRPECFRLPELLVPFIRVYLCEIRPHLIRGDDHCGLWASYRQRSLCCGQIYNIVRRRTKAKFGKAMGLHDIRRSAATFLAMYAPDKVGVIPGVLNHISPQVNETHYNLARSTMASQRHSANIERLRADLRMTVRPREK